jgi:hypothetical protein
MRTKTYANDIRDILSPAEHKIFQKLNAPEKIQNFLDRMPINFRQTHRSVRYTLQKGAAQCVEGSLVAAAALAYHGEPPLLLDLRTLPKDHDHVVTLFKRRGYWGAISKTNHAILRFRDPVYRSVRELAMSYFHEYAMDSGQKTFREFSRPFDLRRYRPEEWVTAPDDLWWLAEALDDSPHERTLPPGMRPGQLRRISKIERQALKLSEWTEWKRPGK